MPARFSQLKPLAQQERAALCLALCGFFSPLNNERIRSELDLPLQQGKLIPLSLMDFFKWAKKQGDDLWPKMLRTRELVLRLVQRGILVPAGNTGGSPGLTETYYFMHELSTLASKGSLWLGTVLGPDYVGYAIQSDIALITGTNDNGDHVIGTGLHIMPGMILTCAHVIDDIQIDSNIKIQDRTVNVLECKSDASVDIGLIVVDEKVVPTLADLAFRKAEILEEVVIAGYPTVPRGLVPTITLQRGEISGRIEETMDQHPVELFSAIARPGNSGGPVVSMDGRIVGLVSRSLERPREEADIISPMPFFSAIPADVIRESFRALTNGLELSWETYD
jgi:Trypsin-like peptidase domain